jgi:hypothetical protein
MRTILNEDVETLLDQQGRVKDDETVTEREDIVACTSFEEFANGALQTEVRWKRSDGEECRLTRPSSCSWSRGLIGPLDFEPWALSRGRR